MKVAHNVYALNSNRQLGITSNALTKSTQKLSSGYKINQASDNAAGLSISEKMRKQIRGLTQASQNCEDGISLVQTADGALEEAQDILQRMNELAVQAANGTNSSTDRSYIQDEVNQLKTEIDRIATTVKFNDTYLLDGSLADPSKYGDVEKQYKKWMEDADKKSEVYTSKYDLQVGQVLSINELDKISGIKIIYDAIGASSSASGNATLAGYTDLKNTLKNSIVPQAISSLISTFGSSLGYLNNSNIGIGLKIENNPASSALASVTLNVPSQPIPVKQLEYTLTVNLATLSSITGPNNSILSANDRQDLEVTIAHEMMHAMMDEALTAGMTGFVSPNYNASQRYPLWFIEGMAQTVGGGCYNGNDWVNGGLGLNSSTPPNTISSIVQNPANKIGSGTTASNYGTGYLACMYLGYLAGGSSINNISQGLDTILKEIRDSASLEDTIKKYTGLPTIGAFENAFGDPASSNFIQVLLGAVGNGAGSVIANSLTAGDILPNGNLPGVTLFQLNPDSDKVTVIHTDDAMTGGTRTSNPATPIVTIPDPINPNPVPLPSGGSYIAANIGFDLSELKGGLKLQVGAEAQNRLTIFIEGMNAQKIGISELSVLTETDATRAIDMVVFALSQVSTQRSSLGAYQNRLEHTIKNLDNIVENTTSAESQIRDTDMAKEMVIYSNTSILGQAGQAMLAQANQMNQGALSLLK